MRRRIHTGLRSRLAARQGTSRAVGDKPEAETFDRPAIVRRGLDELDRRGWEQSFYRAIAAGSPAPPNFAVSPDAVQGLALGPATSHSNARGVRAPLDAGILDAMTELVGKDHEQFLRHGAVQTTGAPSTRNRPSG